MDMMYLYIDEWIKKTTQGDAKRNAKRHNAFSTNILSFLQTLLSHLFVSKYRFIECIARLCVYSYMYALRIEYVNINELLIDMKWLNKYFLWQKVKFSRNIFSYSI